MGSGTRRHCPAASRADPVSFPLVKPVKIDKQTLTTSNKHESEPMKKLYRAWEPAGTVPDACRVNSGPFILLKPVKIDV